MNYDEAIQYIEGYTWSPDRIGLYRIRELLHRLGNPQKQLKFVHIAGSNGKGSTCAMLASILQKAGYHTGLFTSPHLVRYEERMQADGKMIPEEELAGIVSVVREAADRMEEHPSQFELSTAIGMLWFARKQCDVVVLEVGMGGTYDSTNVIDSPEAAVITHIGLEHTEYLGNTLKEIALAKAGIIKEGTVVICSVQEKEVMDAVKEVSKKTGAKYLEADSSRAKILSCDLDGQVFKWGGTDYRLPLLGEHQTANAAAALTCVEALRSRGWIIPRRAVLEGLADASWPARFEVLHKNPIFIVDGGHNPQCAQAIARNIAQYLPGEKITFITGVLADKDYESMQGCLIPYARAFFCVAPDSPRALPAAALADWFRGKHVPARVFGSIREAVSCAVREKASPVLCFGSLYMAGEAREAIKNEFRD